MLGRWKSFSWSWITSRTTVGCYLNDHRRDLQGLDFISLRWMYAPCLSFMWEQSAMDANVTSFPFGSQTCIIFQPFVQVLATRAYWGYYLLLEGKSRFNIHSIHSTNHSWNISLRVPHSGRIPIAQNAHAMVAFDMAGCPSCAGLGAEFLTTLLDAAKTGCPGLFLYSFCSWSSQGQTWICPWLFGKSVRQISWKLDAVKLHLLNRCWLHSLERPSWTHFSRSEAESRGERKFWVQRNQEIGK